MLERLKNWFGKTPESAAAADLYDRIVAAARAPALYRSAGVADSVDGRFDLIALHAFLVFHRMSGVEAWPSVGDRLANRIMTDMDRSLREMGVGDMSVGKKMKKLATAFYGRLDAYWGAVQDDAPDALERALVRNVYRGADDAATARCAELLAAYARAQMAALADQSETALLRGAVRFAAAEELLAAADAGLHEKREAAE